MSSELSELVPGLVPGADGLWLLLLPLPGALLLSLALPLPLLAPLTLPLCFPGFSRGLLEAKSLTHSPMPGTPRRAADALHAPTCVVTCRPRLVGCKLLVTATA